ncbi:zinc finger, CCHC-type containing protein [Tanacetum coccineum]
MAARGQNQRARKNKLAYDPKLKIPHQPKREDLVKDSICHERGKTGHWKRNCPMYLAELPKKKKLSLGASNSGIYTIELNTFLNRSWIYDTGYGIHICKSRWLLACTWVMVNVKLLKQLAAIPRDGIFEIDLSNSYANDSSMYVLSNKRAKLDLDSALLWHCLLGHISKKCIEKLQHDRLLNSTDLRAFKKCVSLENQLGKTIKLLRSDHGGEYMSQEFLDHLKDHRIITHRTPPYTSQHNGVSERRNRTLLNMVRSMMSQTTLPKSFWDYDLETATRILNMVPTKKVEKTPYEIYKCIFIGYPKETIGYSFYYPPKNKVLIAWNAEFLENSLITQEASRSLEDLEIIQEEDTHPSIHTSLNHKEDDLEIDEPQSDINPIHRSTRTRRPIDRLCLYIDAEEHGLGILVNPQTIKLHC